MAAKSAGVTVLPSLDECQHLDWLLQQLIESSEAERAARLAELAREDPERCKQVRELLELSEHSFPAVDSQSLDLRPAWHLLNELSDKSPIGREIGAWRVVRYLGCGGMGSVYEVERADGAYAQRAALKLITNAMQSSEFSLRFANERQILAALNHVGIARLIDGGQDSEQRSYLVMELVDGERIDHYCQRHKLALQARLELFLQVANAVAHAHLHRVVHRDIKPSNLLVTPDGIVKLLDFGIAKVLADNASEHIAELTMTGLLTPQYATPEQVMGQKVDHRSDIYQLGLLLFELLTTQRAQQPVDGTPAALLDVVCADSRPPPSMVVLNAPTDRAIAVGGVTQHALSRALSGDLDAIVLQALRKEPERRYASVQAFIEDVQRYRAGLSVLARPESMAFRAVRLLRRHPWTAGSAAAVLLLSIAYAVTATLQARALVIERDRATLEAQKAEQVKGLILRMFEQPNPEVALGKELTARQLLDSSWPLIQAETQDQPQIQVELLTTMAETYRHLGNYDIARERLAAAEQLLVAHPHLPLEIQAATQRELGRVLTDRGEYVLADQALRGAYDLFVKKYGKRHRQAAITLIDQGQLEFERHHLDAAEQLYREALALFEPVIKDRVAVDCMERLAEVLTEQNQFSEAASMLEATLALQRKLLPPGHPDIAANQSNLAEAWKRLGRLPQAESMFRESLANFQHSHGDDHPFVVIVMNNLARTLKQAGKLAEAESLLRSALAMRRTRFGEEHELVASTLNDLASVLELKGEFDASEKTYRQALDIVPAANRLRGQITGSLGRIEQVRGNFAMAERLYREALAIKLTHFGKDYDTVGLTLQDLGSLLLAQGRKSEAEPILREALRIYHLRLDLNHPRTQAVTLLLEQLTRQPN